MSKTITTRRKNVAAALVLLQFILSIALVWVLSDFGILPYKYMNLLVAGLTVLLAITACLACFRKGALASCILSVLFTFVLGLGTYYINITQKALQNMEQDEDTYVFSVLSMATSALDSKTGLTDKSLGVVRSIEGDYEKQAESEVLGQWENITLITYDSYFEAVAALTDHQVDALLFLEDMREPIEETFTAFSLETSILSTVNVKMDIALEDSDPEDSDSEIGDESGEESEDDYVPGAIAEGPFAVLLVGADSRAKKISTYGNHDVNILAVINPVTKVILLISTPRDFYVDVPYSSTLKDKLTHAGCYSGGAKCSAKTIGLLYGINVKYYVKIGFTGFKNVVNAVGGVDVYSEVAFTSSHWGDKNGKYKFVAGVNHMNGAQALAFVRERYNLDALGGDRQRGKNQMAVIKAVLQKALSPDILTKYTSILASLEGQVLYNVKTDDIAALVRMQLHDMSSWKIYSYSVNGSGKMDYTASYPKQKLYVMVPNQTTVDNAKKYIQEVFGGKTPSI